MPNDPNPETGRTFCRSSDRDVIRCIAIAQRGHVIGLIGCSFHTMEIYLQSGSSVFEAHAVCP